MNAPFDSKFRNPSCVVESHPQTKDAGAQFAADVVVYQNIGIMWLKGLVEPIL